MASSQNNNEHRHNTVSTQIEQSQLFRLTTSGGENAVPWRLFLFRSVAILALGLCAAITADDLGPHPFYCGFRGGCDEVLASPIGHPFGIPLSLIGIIGFAGLFLLAILSDGRAGVVLLVTAVIAGVAGAALISIQLAVLHRSCALCLLVDACAIALALLAAAQCRSPDGVALSSWPTKAAWFCVGALALLAPLAGAWLRPVRSVPEQV